MYDHGSTNGSDAASGGIAVLPNPILLINQRGMVLDASQGAAGVLRVPREELLQGGWLRFLKDAPSITNQIADAAARGITAFDFEAERRGPDGLRFAFDCVSLPDRSGHFSVTLTEGARERHLPAAYRGTYDRFLEKVDGARAEGFWMLDASHGTVTWSDNPFDLLRDGEKEAVISEEHARTRFHQEDRPKLIEAVSGCLERGEPVNFHARLVRQEGAIRHVVVRGQKNSDGTKIFGVFTDLTDEINADMVARETADRLSLVQEASKHGVWDWHIGREQMYCSDHMKRTLGLDLRGNGMPVSKIMDTIHPDDVDRYREKLRACVIHGDPLNAEVRVRVPHGDVEWVEIKAALGRGPNGQPMRIVGTVADITPRRRTETDLRTAQAEAEDASNAKSEFVATVSHELRTPLNGIIGMLELLSQGNLTTEQQPLADTAADSARGLLAILDDLLDLSKLGADRLELSPETFDPAELARGVTRLFGPAAGKQHVSLTFEAGENLPPAVSTDRGRLRQIISNLVGNAVKFTRDGTVTVSMMSETAADGRHMLRCRVTDTGIGIDGETLNALFEPYSQGRSSFAEFGGTGLGLAICKRLAERMGGEIGVDSTQGQGSTFWFTVAYEPATPASRSVPGSEASAAPADAPVPPAPTADRPARPPAEAAPAQGHDLAPAASAAAPEKTTAAAGSAPAAAPGPAPEGAHRGHLLIAEDNHVNQRVITAMVSRLGYSYDIVPDGAEAVEAARKGGYDAVLMDVQMPRIDGVMATRLIREEERDTGAYVPIIAITAHAMRGTREEYLAAGMSDFLPKPISVKALAVTLQKFASRAESDSEEEKSTAFAAHSA